MVSLSLLRRRSFTAFATIAALLFAQLALAGYACPAAADAQARTAMAAMAAAGLPCAAMDDALPALCHEHGVAAAQSSEHAKQPVPTPPRVVTVVVLPAAPEGSLHEPPAWQADQTPRPPPDPIFLATLRLRV
jgi:hypothetical protein